MAADPEGESAPLGLRASRDVTDEAAMRLASVGLPFGEARLRLVGLLGPILLFESSKHGHHHQRTWVANSFTLASLRPRGRSVNVLTLGFPMALNVVSAHPGPMRWTHG